MRFPESLRGDCGQFTPAPRESLYSDRMDVGWDGAFIDRDLEVDDDPKADDIEEDDDDAAEEPAAIMAGFIARHHMHPFEALAEPARRRIIDVLASGEHTAGELAAVVGGEFRISRTAVSKHLRILRDSGFVDVRGDFQWRWYRLASLGLDVLELIVADLRHKWNLRVGWDEERLQENDPLSTFARPVPRKGPGRPVRRGHRGTQEIPPLASEPDQGWFRSS